MEFNYLDWGICCESPDALQVSKYEWIGRIFHEQSFIYGKLRIYTSISNPPLTPWRPVWILWISNYFRWIIFFFIIYFWKDLCSAEVKKKIEDLSHCLDVNRNDQKSSHFYWCIPGMLGTSRNKKKNFWKLHGCFLC